MTEGDLSYSPQDARSDLPKTKKKNKHPQQGQATAGSPESRKLKPKKRQEAPKKENTAASVGVTSVEAAQQTAKVGVVKSSPEVVPEAVTTGGIPKDRPHANKANASDASNEAPSVVVQEQRLVDDSAEPVDALGATNDVPDPLLSQLQNIVAKSPPPQSSPDVQSQDESRKMPYSNKKSKEAEEVTRQSASTKIPEDDDVAPEDEVNNEASFRSVAVSRTKLTVKEEIGCSSGTMKHGCTSATPKVVKTSEDGLPASPTLPVEIASADTAISLQDEAPPPDREPPVSAEKAGIMLPANLKIDQPVTIAEEVKPTSTTVSVTVDPPKKAGAQQTESLHPFSKAAKVRAKKEKEQKKKAQKKEKEQADKAKAAKATADKSSLINATAENDVIDGETGQINESKSTDDAESAEGDAVVGSSAALVKDVPTEEVVPASLPDSRPIQAAATSQQITHDYTILLKGKGKERCSPVYTSEESVANHGKQLDGIISTFNEHSLVTDKEVNIKMPNAPPEPDVPCSKQEEMGEANAVLAETGSAARLVEDPSPSAKKKPKKKKKKQAPPAWPNLDFRPKSPNPSWMGPIDSATDTQNYDEIMTKAIGGDDDSEFSWSDLPKVEDILPPQEGDWAITREDSGADQVPDLVKKRVASLEARSAGLRAEKGKPQAFDQKRNLTLVVTINQHMTELKAMQGNKIDI